jgi:2-(1,2-epoxy-1,2-dihydrophenyl)acetyl-CoA isomerase
MGNPMDYQTIRLTEEGGIAVLTLSRPDRMNALNTQMRAEILHAVRAAGQSARVLVLTGEGRAFCSGRTWATGRRRRTPTSNARSATNTSRC